MKLPTFPFQKKIPLKEKLTGIKDLDILVLKTIDSDRDLLQLCSTNSYFNNLCDDEFFYNRMKERYPYLLKSKPKKLSWKNHYLNNVRYIYFLDEDFGFKYTEKSTGTPKEYYYPLAGMAGLGTGKPRKMPFVSEKDRLYYALMIADNRDFKDLKEFVEDKLHE